MRISLSCFVFVLIALSLEAKADCKALKSSAKVQMTFNYVSNLAKSGSWLWPNYSVSSVPIILTSTKEFPECIAIINGQKLSVASKDANFPKIANKLYDFCGGIPGFPACPSVDDTPLSAAVIYELNNNVGPAVESIGFEAIAIDFTTIAHEGFHFFGQALGAAQNGWWNKLGTIGVSLEGRDAISKQCYAQNSKVLELTKMEIRSLQEATRAAFDGNSTSEIKSKIKQFFSARKSRYQLLSAVTFDDDGVSLTCPEAEASMEFMEGIAEFIGLQSGLDSKALSPTQLQDWIGQSLKNMESPDSLYYRTGAMALLIIKRIDPSEYEKVVNNLTHSQSIEKLVMYEFERWAVQ